MSKKEWERQSAQKIDPYYSHPSIYLSVPVVDGRILKMTTARVLLEYGTAAGVGFSRPPMGVQREMWRGPIEQQREGESERAVCSGEAWILELLDVL